MHHNVDENVTFLFYSFFVIFEKKIDRVKRLKAYIFLLKICTVYLFFLQDFILPSVNVNVYRSLVHDCNKIIVLSYYPIRNISLTRFLIISLKVKSLMFFHLVIFRFTNNAYAMQFRGFQHLVQ